MRRRLREAADELVEARPEVRAVYLFGSLAGDRAVPGSDADLLIVLSSSERRWLDRPLEYDGFFRGAGMPVELFCHTGEEVERVTLARRALASGMKLAGAWLHGVPRHFSASGPDISGGNLEVQRVTLRRRHVGAGILRLLRSPPHCGHLTARS